MILQTDKDKNLQPAKTNGNVPKLSDRRSRHEVVSEPKTSRSEKAATGKRATPPKLYRGEQGNELEGEPDSVLHTFGTLDYDLIGRLMAQVRFASPDLGEDHGGINASLASIHAIAPRDGLESMLATQMVVTHNHALSCLEKMKRAGLSEELVDAYYNRANKCMRTFAMQYAVLKKNRQSGADALVVEQVHVHEGGQAVVNQVGQQALVQDSEEENERAN